MSGPVPQKLTPAEMEQLDNLHKHGGLMGKLRGALGPKTQVEYVDLGAQKARVKEHLGRKKKQTEKQKRRKKNKARKVAQRRNR